jgi:allantoin racemase
MKLLYIFPRMTPDANERAAEHAFRREKLQRMARPGTTVDIRELDEGPPAVESLQDTYAVAPGIIAMARELESDYDAMIVGCFTDPAVDGAIEATRIPIVGTGLPSMVAALLLGSRFAILSPTANSAARTRKMVMSNGLLDRFACALPLGIGVREFQRDPERTLAAASEVGRQAVDSGADVILLGCLSLAFTDVTEQLQERLGVPVVNPVRVAVSTAEMLVSAGLTPRRFPPPTVATPSSLSATK